jgi:ureidoglycolate lyase
MSGNSVARRRRRPLPGSGLPDLDNLRAFIAKGSQAVTYGAGTWHAPMVVLGNKPVDFVVVQYANGVGLEDCQEVEIKGHDLDHAITISIPRIEESENTVKAKL